MAFDGGGGGESADISVPVVDGGFSFDPGQIDAVWRGWVALQADLTGDEELGRALAEVVGPGKDPASDGMASCAANSGVAFFLHSLSLWAFVHAYVENLRGVRNAYLAHDDTSRLHYRVGE